MTRALCRLAASAESRPRDGQLVDLGVHVADARVDPRLVQVGQHDRDLQPPGEQQGDLRAIRPGADHADLGHRPGQRLVRRAGRAPGPLLHQVERVQAGRAARRYSIRSARASSSAANPSSRVAVPRRRHQVECPVRRGRGAVQLAVGEEPRRGDGGVPLRRRSSVPAPAGRRDGDRRAGQHPAPPSAATPRGSRRARTWRPRCPSSKASGPRSILFCASGFSMITLSARGRARSAAAAGRRRPSRAPGRGSTRAARPSATPARDRPVGAVQRDLEAAAQRHAVDEAERRARPARRAAGTPRGRAWRRRAPDRGARPPGSAPAGRGDRAAAPSRSAPAARMNGLPVTPTAATSPAAARAATASSAAFSDSRPCGPNVFGLVWSSPLSRVIRARTPGGRRPGRRHGRCALVTTSPGQAPSPSRHAGSVRGYSSSLRSVSQSTVPPMPMPTHIVVRP